jgi:transposase
MLIKTILNKIEKSKSFVYEEQARFERINGKRVIIVPVRARKNTHGICKICGNKHRCYDKLHTRLYEYVPLWGIPLYFEYKPRRVNCPVDGIHVEKVPWSEGKDQMTRSYKIFLACWAKRLSWKETADIFSTSWNRVYKSVKYVVNYGLEHRNLDNIEQIGIDEIAVFKGHNYLTLVYQIDKGIRRLLWCGEHRKVKTLIKFFRWFGKERCLRLKYVCSDMWKPYLKVIRKKATNALNILDRFHIMKKFNESIDNVRREEVKKLVNDGKKNVLESGRWVLLKNTCNLTDKQTVRLTELLKINLSSVKAYLMREDFQQFWQYKDSVWADQFLEDWVDRTMQSDIKPMKKVAKMLRRHKELILNWFRTENRLSSGTVEGLNTKAKVTVRKSYGFRTPECLKIALYHTLGSLPDPPITHTFC